MNYFLEGVTFHWDKLYFQAGVWGEGMEGMGASALIRKGFLKIHGVKEKLQETLFFEDLSL